MKDLFYKLKALIMVAGMIIIPVLIGNILYYAMGCLIALDPNPANWWLIQETLGRVILIVLELVLFVNAPKFWDELY
jgi:hypothetical protein